MRKLLGSVGDAGCGARRGELLADSAGDECLGENKVGWSTWTWVDGGRTGKLDVSRFDCRWAPSVAELGVLVIDVGEAMSASSRG